MEEFTFARKILDDTLVWAPDIPIFFERIEQIARYTTLCFQRKRFFFFYFEKGSYTKLLHVSYGQGIPFARKNFSDKGIISDPERTRAISDFPRPKYVMCVPSLVSSGLSVIRVCARLCPLLTSVV